MARMFRRTTSTASQRPVFDDFEPQSEWMEDPVANILKIYLPGFSKDQVRMAPGTNPNTIKVLGIHPLETKNKYRRFEKEFTIPDNTKVDEMNVNFDNESFIITFPKDIEDKIPVQTMLDEKVDEKKLDDKMNDQIQGTTHEIVFEPKKDRDGEQEATPKVITSIDDKRVDERKEVADQIRPESESPGHAKDNNLAKLMESEGKKKDKDLPLVENVVPTVEEPKPVILEDSTMLKDKETKKERVDEEPSLVNDVVSKGDKEPPSSVSQDLESRVSTVSPPQHRETEEEEKKGEEKVHEPSLVEDVVSKTKKEPIPKSEVEGKEGKPEKPSLMGSVVTQDNTRFEEKEHKKEMKEPPILEGAVSKIAELEIMKKNPEAIEEGTKKDVMNVTMEDINVVIAAAKKTLQLQASKVNRETEITVSVALSLFDILAAIGSYISHEANTQRRSRN